MNRYAVYQIDAPLAVFRFEDDAKVFLAAMEKAYPTLFFKVKHYESKDYDFWNKEVEA